MSDDLTQVIEEQCRPYLANFAAAAYTAADIEGSIRRYLDRRDKYVNALEQIGREIQDSSENLLVSKKIHSVRWRVKDPGSLIVKLIDRFINKDRKTTKDNIFEGPDVGITDLGAFRIIHLYRHDWSLIDAFIRNNPKWTVVEATAYVPYDKKEQYAVFERVGSKGGVVTSDDGYTSIHYILKYSYNEGPSKMVTDLFIELQVRTLFEEGWASVSHECEYKGSSTHLVHNQLMILGKAADIANDIASALGALRKLPRFIPWEQEQQLESTATAVFCLTPNLRWALENTNELTALLRKADSLQYHFLLSGPPDLGEELRAKLVNESVSNRIHIHMCDPRYPLVSDMLLIKGASIGKIPVKADVCVIGTPLDPMPQEIEKFDVVVFDEGSVQRVRRFFTELLPETFRTHIHPL